jgi:hypothetical protein
MIGQVLGWLGNFLQNLFKVLFTFLGNLFGYLIQKMIDFLTLIFRPVLIVIALLFYFILQVATLVVKLLQVLLGIGKIFVALLKGILATIAGFTWTSSPRDDGQWTSIFHNLADGMGSYQLDNVSYVLMFLIWFGTAFAAIRIISSMSGGGEGA